MPDTAAGPKTDNNMEEHSKGEIHITFLIYPLHFVRVIPKQNTQ
jgi:hypothetical protein